MANFTAVTTGLFNVELRDPDNLHALALFENGDGVFTRGLNPILFSARRGSTVIGFPDSLYGLPIEEGDVGTVSLSGTLEGLPPIFFPPRPSVWKRYRATQSSTPCLATNLMRWTWYQNRAAS